jgi:ribonuclease P protein component
MIGRLLQSADFERVLAAPTRSRSAHFALHHLAAPPLPPKKPRPRPLAGELSTSAAPGCPQAVDDLLCDHWIGCVVPKRHAKRAVTRSLLKRQIRGAFAREAGRLPAGQWLVRLRSPFAPQQFVSARSELLARAARSELDALFARVAHVAVSGQV